MIADVEKPDHTYERREMGQPVCGEDFCDHCGDCLVCYSDYCEFGCSWVIYLENPKNPYAKVA